MVARYLSIWNLLSVALFAFVCVPECAALVFSELGATHSQVHSPQRRSSVLRNAQTACGPDSLGTANPVRAPPLFPRRSVYTI
ncbi:hypothetical protein EDB86DRAFT_2956534 [Lactarius hatsudake]|nr:hypothetical protein EDB86DRAFT_2956534 [Lactarius hatsudake]